MPNLRASFLSPALALTAASALLSGCAMNSTAPAAASPASAVVPGRYIVVYDPSATSTPSVATLSASTPLAALGMSVQQLPGIPASEAIARLSAQPGVLTVLQDRIVSGGTLRLHPHQDTSGSKSPAPPSPGPISLSGTTADSFYNSPQGWAVRQAGGYGSAVTANPATGPWTTTTGRGIRIAILDTGVDATHPDIAPHLALNSSEIDQTASPSTCDDGSSQDQQGHGTFAASLAAGAAGSTTGSIIGVAPDADILNIKVMQRMPASDASASDLCSAGQPGGLLSWVLQGINDAVANHADVISLSLGSVVDLNTGDGAGWKATFDRVTHAASNSGVLIVAALGNNGLDLSSGRYIELPAQARDVLPVTASTNPACAEILIDGATCAPGPITRAFYSNYGVPGALAAPGGSYPAGPDNAVSGWVRGACSTGKPNTVSGPPSDSTHSFGCFDHGHAAYVQAIGTSASAPLAAGAAALLRSAHPGWTTDKLASVLRSTATPSTPAVEPQINTAAALAAQ